MQASSSCTNCLQLKRKRQAVIYNNKVSDDTTATHIKENQEYVYSPLYHNSSPCVKTIDILYVGEYHVFLSSNLFRNVIYLKLSQVALLRDKPHRLTLDSRQPSTVDQGDVTIGNKIFLPHPIHAMLCCCSSYL